MISAWKRFINKSDSPNTNGQNGTISNGYPSGIRKLDKELQKKFARGVNYNMKVVIKGDAKVGKTSLFMRLKGYDFNDQYVPTETLSATSIDWNYKATDDVVKIDLWEAVDSISSKRKVNFIDLKLENKKDDQRVNVEQPSDKNDGIDDKNRNTSRAVVSNTTLSINGSNVSPIPQSAQQSLTELSENFDVYKGSDVILLVMDMTKQWTFKYVQSELPKIPKNIPVLVIANFRDQGHHRTVSAEQVQSCLAGLNRDHGDGVVMYTEASMKNGFGLKLIEKFLNIPFLKLQERSLLKQLELNRTEFVTTLEELELMQESTNKEYENYLEIQTIRRRQEADAMSPVNSGLKPLNEATREQIRNATMSSEVAIGNAANVKSIESKPDIKSEAKSMASQNFVNDRLPSIVIGAKCPLPESKALQVTLKPSDCSKECQKDSNTNTASDDSDEEEIPSANPLVSGYQSDLDSDDRD